ncbi:acyl-CoA dehydrogenase family protein [Maribacter cobaltidurans]|uniref:Uncharacterized protein n=1 Tax=Maribacter cobaltidurans TaxID=1178778 RepID=A0A223V0Y1_9FLAO|nr:acyl-CoA dehydrogenase family protein [Maribacter cobaltidurans]ASV28840.1 hypothetical protein CJ263_00555 [Maribacter cobaltidurans]GGD74371.1 hydroxylase [Maribacter cobaltidurans]
MNNTSTLPRTSTKPLAAAEKVYPIALDLREETEKSRKLASPIVEKLAEQGLFRMALPKFLGGIEDNPVETLNVYELLSSAEASVAWITWNNHLACTFGRYLNKEDMKKVYGDPMHVYANSTRPEGFAKKVAGGYMVSGRWTLVSGCELADWFVLRCLVTSDENPATLGPGAVLKLVFLPKKQVKIIDTWSVGGLRGTGSHDIEVEETFVPENLAVGFEDDVPLKTPYSRLPIGCINASGNGAMSLGLLRGALDELTQMCLERVTPGKNPDLRDRPAVQAALAKGNTILKSHRAELHRAVDALWKASVNGESFSDELLADIWSASCEAASASRAMITELFAVAGTSSLYTKFRMERIHRDIHGVLQHGIVQPHWMNQAGMAYAGLKPTAAMFGI